MLKAQLVGKGANEKFEDEICDLVLGKRYGYTHGLGYGILPPSFSSSNCFHPDVEKLRRRAKTTERQDQGAERHNE